MSKKHRKHGKAAQPAPAPQKPWVSPEVKYAKHPRYYVGYGSNHNVIQMQARCTSAMPVCAGMMPGTRLVFSSVLTVEKVEGEQTPVTIWHVEARDIAALDRYEGYPRLYSKRYSHVTVDGLRVPAFYYVLNPPYEEEPPVDYYYETCAEGYRDWGLDLAYLDAARDRAQLAEEARGERAHVCAFCSERLPQKEMERLSRNEWLCNDCAAYMYGQHYYAKDMSRRRAAPVADNKEGPR